MIAAAAFVLSLLFGLAAGRFVGQRGWLVVPALPVLTALVSLVDVDYVDPLLLVVSLLWAALAAVGVLLGLALRRRSRTTGSQAG